MIIKFDKKFQPMPMDGGDEFFPNGIFEFNITKMTAYIQANPDRFPVEDAPLDGLWDSSFLDERAIQSANISNPIILAEIRPTGFNVIDGNHRVARAKRDGYKVTKAYRIGPDQHYRFMTSVEAYKEYVSYWNSKVREIKAMERHALGGRGIHENRQYVQKNSLGKNWANTQ